MSWTTYHRRGQVLRAVIEAADARRDGRLPLDVEGVDATFDDELDLLCALQLRWHTRLAGRIESELAAQPLDLESAVVAAWHGVADALPGIRAILDAHRIAPPDTTTERVIATCVAKERALLAVGAGRASVSDHEAPAVGARIEQRARATYVPGRGAARRPDGRGVARRPDGREAARRPDGREAARRPDGREAAGASLLRRIRAVLAA